MKGDFHGHSHQWYFSKMTEIPENFCQNPIGGHGNTEGDFGSCNWVYFNIAKINANYIIVMIELINTACAWI